MKDDELLYLTGETIREPDALDDPRWDQLAAGELDDDELKALKEITAEQFDAENVAESFKPMDQGMHRRVEALFGAGAAEAEDAPQPVTQLSERQAKTAQEALPPSPWIRRTLGMVGVLGAAAALLLILLVNQDPAVVLPTYQMDLRGGIKAVRSSQTTVTDQPPSFDNTSLLTIRLRPETKVSEALFLTGYLKGPAETKKLDLPFKVSSSGTITISGKMATLLGSPVPGRYELHLVVVPQRDAAELPTDLEALSREKGTTSPWQTFVQPLTVVAP